MRIEDVKPGMKVKIVSNPEKYCFGDGLVGQILTTTGEVVEQFVYCQEFLDGAGAIKAKYIEPVDEEKKMFTKSDLKDFMRVQYMDGRVRLYAQGGFYSNGEYTRGVDDYDDDLIHTGAANWDIVKVWEAPGGAANLFDENCVGALLFDREKEEASGKKQKEIEEAENRIKEAKALLEEATAHLSKLKGDVFREKQDSKDGE